MNDTKNEDEIIIEEEAATSPAEEADEASKEEVLFEEGSLESTIQELQDKLKAEHERLLRTAADLDNLRKRSRREIDDALIRGRTEVLREILPVMDSIDSALKNADPDGPASGVLTGVEMVRKQFLNVTSQFGLVLVAAEGKPFDPYYHEAVAQIESKEHEPGQVVQEMRPGYMLGDRLVRASMVIVCQGKPSVSPADAAADDAEDHVEPDGAEVDDSEPLAEQSSEAAEE